MKSDAGYQVLLETIGDGPAARAHLHGPDGQLIGMYSKGSKTDAVESACTSLIAMGRHDEANAIRRSWKAQHGTGDQGGAT